MDKTLVKLKYALNTQRGTMCLAAVPKPVPGSIAEKLYGKNEIIERHRHRYEVNNFLLPQIIAAGMVISGRSQDNLVEMIELSDHPWFVACQFHPEFTSTPRDGHPLFNGFVRAAKVYQAQQEKSNAGLRI